MTLKTIDAHVAGQPLRLVVDGFPSPRGRTMADKRDWVARHADHLRRILMREPRGHADMCGALLTEPVSPGSHAGILFMDNDGYSHLSAHGVMATTAIALERGLLMAAGDARTIVYDTPAGTIRAHASPPGGTSGCTVTVLSVPSFVLMGGLAVTIGARANRQIRADVAFGGGFYAIVDSESAGLPLDAAHVPELRRMGIDITRAIDAVHQVNHPLDPQLKGIDGTIFTGPSIDGQADLRTVTVFANGQIDRSPCGTGMAGVMAVLNAMSLLPGEATFVAESLIGTRFPARVKGRTSIGEHEAIVTEIDGTAWITGEHTFLVDDDDPLSEGFVMGSA